MLYFGFDEPERTRVIAVPTINEGYIQERHVCARRRVGEAVGGVPPSWEPLRGRGPFSRSG
jgi:hypothetical protein